MPINVKVKDNNIKSYTVKKIKKETISFKLDIKKTLNGDLMIFDHNDIDIVMLLEKRKIVSFPKDSINDAAYGAQNRFFAFLRKKGIIAFDSIQGGNVYGSLEGVLNESKDQNEFKIALKNISEWMKTEEPAIDYDEMVDDAYLEPDADNSTELGEVPHEDEKGSIRRHNLFAPYLYGRYSW